MELIIKQLSIKNDKRIICISDIHGNYPILEQLLKKVSFCSEDVLILLGDLFMKGPFSHETLKKIIDLSKLGNVYPLFGNCDFEEDYFTEDEKNWINSLPHIIESERYVFVHAGLTSLDFANQDYRKVLAMPSFLEEDYRFDKYVIHGHWPCNNYCHEIACYDPIVNEDKKIIAIDGGNVVKSGGQLNAFIIENGQFSFESIDSLLDYTIQKDQYASGGDLHITWKDRFIELIDEGSEFSLYRHLASGKKMLLANKFVWTDKEGNLCGCEHGTNYFLPVKKGETVSLIHEFSDRLLVKRNGIEGWILK